MIDDNNNNNYNNSNDVMILHTRNMRSELSGSMPGSGRCWLRFFARTTEGTTTRRNTTTQQQKLNYVFASKHRG